MLVWTQEYLHHSNDYHACLYLSRALVCAHWAMENPLEIPLRICRAALIFKAAFTPRHVRMLVIQSEVSLIHFGSSRFPEDSVSFVEEYLENKI